jgi:hypothetical protein
MSNLHHFPSINRHPFGGILETFPIDLIVKKIVFAACLFFALGALIFARFPEIISAKPAASTITVAAAGDIACDFSATPQATHRTLDTDEISGQTCHQQATANLITAMHPDLVLALGDEQYADGTYSAFKGSYDRSWGAFKSITRPAPGNHEYHTTGATGYYRYFGTLAGAAAKGYYSFGRGAWHFIALNANCNEASGCGSGSPEERWLRQDLAEHRTAACTLAYWHQPRFSSGLHHSDPAYTAFWRDLYTAGADLVLNGHDHDYERFAPQTPDGTLDKRRGIREIIVGTGGRSHYPEVQVEPHSEARNDVTFGVLELRLRAHDYTWKFIPERGGTFTDAGSGVCHHASA